jgi:glycosyltransferase involved in cell wall biosynthesis
MNNRSVLWIASWYPNPAEPYDGDFIQRHARALATQQPVDVIFIAQLGEQKNTEENIRTESINGVEETIVVFKFKSWGIPGVDKLRYNIAYHRAARKALREYIARKGKPDLVHIHVPMKAGMIAMWLNRTLKMKYIVSEHSSLYDQTAPGNFFERSRRHKATVKRIFKKAAAVSTVSAAVGKTMQQVFQLAPVHVIHNTVDTSLFHYKLVPKQKFRFIHVSTLTHQKNIQAIIFTAKRLYEQRQDFEMYIVGPQDDALKEFVREQKLGAFIVFTGEVSYPEVAKLMQSASAFVLFSRHENFPCVLIEAQCCGLPCIAANVGGIAESVDPSNGILVEAGNEEALLAAMKQIMNGHDQFNAQQIAATAAMRYSYEVIGKAFSDWYEKL